MDLIPVFRRRMHRRRSFCALLFQQAVCRILLRRDVSDRRPQDRGDRIHVPGNSALCGMSALFKRDPALPLYSYLRASIGSAFAAFDAG